MSFLLGALVLYFQSRKKDLICKGISDKLSLENFWRCCNGEYEVY